MKKQGHSNQAWMIRIVVVVAVLLGVALLAAPETSERKHLVPADKGLSRKYIQGLYERGERAVYTGDDLETIGMPVGGIAAGQLYLRGDGTLGLWQIFNEHVFTGYGRDCYRTYRPDSPVDSGFALVVKSGGKQTLRPLNRDFGTVAFAGEYPIGLVRYEADDLPVTVEMEAFSPFVPLNAEDSALPATVFHIDVKNTSDEPQEVSLLGWLENAVCFHSIKSVHAVRRTRVASENDRTLIVHTAQEAQLEEAEDPRTKIVLADFEGQTYGEWQTTGDAFGAGPARGTLPDQQAVSGFQGDGLVNTYLGGDAPKGTLTSPAFEITRKYIHFLLGGGNHANQTCINLLVDDDVVRTATGTANEKLEWRFWDVKELEGKTARIEIVDRHSGGWGHINVDQIELTDRPKEGDTVPFEKLPDYGSLVLALDGPMGEFRRVREALQTYSDEGLPEFRKPGPLLATQTATLAPQAERTFTFVLTWFFPNHEHGREYANRFTGAADVARYVLDNHDRLAGQTKKWHHTFYEDSTLPRWLLFRLHSTVSNLATGTAQWWGNGRFWAWEGVGCCPGTCTHVWNYAHAAARLFPELERSAREKQDLGEGFHPDSGLVGFRSNHAYAADGQCGTVLKAYREHQCSPDHSFLWRNWPKIKKALEFSIEQDGNDDGLIEASQHNTFDINFEGPNTFVGSLYLAALRAGEEMAAEMGDTEFAERCRKIFESGRRLSSERLWDDEYFIQIVNLEKHPKHQYGRGCLSDQLFGQGWAHHLGLGYIYPAGQVTEALRSVWKYNWTPDVGPYNGKHKPERWFALPGQPGLFTCTWPKSPYMAEGVRYRSEVWTGIEYQVAGHMVWEGMLDEAMAICHGIQQRYHPSKHNPFNEVECGDHYARALASWGIYTALAGFEYHGPKGYIAFAPRIAPEDFRAAFTTAEGWGLFTQSRSKDSQRNRIDLRWGRLDLKKMALAIPESWKAADVTVRVDNTPVNSKVVHSNGQIRISLVEDLELTAGDELEIRMRRKGR